MDDYEVAELENTEEAVMQIRISNAVSQILSEVTRVSSAASKVDITKLEYVFHLVDSFRKKGFNPDQIVEKFDEAYNMAKKAGDYKAMLKACETITKIVSDTKTTTGNPINEIKQINIQNNSAPPLSPEDMELMKVKKAKEAMIKGKVNAAVK